MIGGVTSELLHDLWCRGAAAQCAFGPPNINGLIVTYIGDLDESFYLKKLGCFT